MPQLRIVFTDLMAVQYTHYTTWEVFDKNSVILITINLCIFWKEITDCELSPVGNVLAAASYDGYVKFWQVQIEDTQPPV